MTTLRRLTSLLAVVAMMLTMTAIPAMAVVQASATITSGDLLSNNGGQVVIRIANNAEAGVLGVGGGSTIDVFQIEVPQDLVDVNLADVTLPAGWIGGYDEELGFLFGQADKDDVDNDGKTSNGLAPSQSMNVSIGVKADLINDDRTRPFTTFASDDGGMTFTHIGSPQVTSRILEIRGLEIVKPEGATNADASQVTAGQDNAKVRLAVRNHGGADRAITANVEKKDGTSSLTKTTPATSTLAAGTGGNFLVGVTFGAAGSLTLNGLATTDNSAAGKKSSAALTVQAAFAANLVADSLQPKAVAQGTTTNITYRINKTAGAQPVNAAATFTATKDTESFTATADQLFDAPNGQKTVTFPNVTISDSLTNGEYTTQSTLTGTDGNGATVSLTVNPGKLVLDNLVPVVNITLLPGDSDVPGATPATTSGREIEYDGTIGLSEGTGLCTNCTITKAELVMLPSMERRPMNVVNTGGELSGSGTFQFVPGTTGAYAEVTAKRNSTGATNNLVNSGVSNTLIVDLIKPTLTSAITFRGDDGDKVIVEVFDDGLLVDITPSAIVDWSVDNNTVTAIEGKPQGNGATQVILSLRSELDPNATPAVSYAPAAIRDRIHDRVSLTMEDQSVDATDGIIPDAPVLETVGGLSRQDGEFWINDSTPEVGLADLVPGNTLEIFLDTNDNGAVDAGDKKVYTAPVNSETETVTLSDLGSVELRHELLARMVDEAANIGVLAKEHLNLDFTAARITDYKVEGQNVTVLFDEPVVRGRDAAFDWAVQATDSTGRTAFRTVTSVSGSGAERVLTVSTSSWDGSGTVDAIRYKFRGFNPADRYDDRATNQVLDQLYPPPPDETA